MKNLIIIIILAVILGSAIYYIYKEKKKGRTCIGCPYSKDCSEKNCHSVK